jgi:hypothetical protein
MLVRSSISSAMQPLTPLNPNYKQRQTEDNLVLYVLERNIIIKKATLLIMGSVVIL